MIFVELGRKLHALGLLEEPRDIFFLEVNDVLGFITGTTTGLGLRPNIQRVNPNRSMSAPDPTRYSRTRYCAPCRMRCRASA